MTPTRAISIAAAVLALSLTLLLPGVSLADEMQPAGRSDDANTAALLNARDATAAYTNQAAAQAAGYELLTDAAGIACIEEPGAGAMGIHYVKGALVQSGTIDPARPQALVYELQANGGLHLVAVEYVALQDAWDATHDAPPSLFGESFMLTPAGNRFGLPAFYSLHAWIWKNNPSGTFSMWNPTDSCGAPLGAAAPRGGTSSPTAYACGLAAERQLMDARYGADEAAPRAVDLATDANRRAELFEASVGLAHGSSGSPVWGVGLDTQPRWD